MLHGGEGYLGCPRWEGACPTVRRKGPDRAPIAALAVERVASFLGGRLRGSGADEESGPLNLGCVGCQRWKGRPSLSGRKAAIACLKLGKHAEKGVASAP